MRYKKDHVHKRIDYHLHARDYEKRHIPLPGTFMITSIIGLTISIIFTLSGTFNQWFLALFPKGGPYQGYAWGTAFTVAFLIMFISSIITITPSGRDIRDIEDAEGLKNI